MSWLTPRALLAALAFLLGCGVALVLGFSSRAMVLGGLAGSGALLVAALVLDGWRGHRLLRWLRGSQQGAAPRDTGYWGELGYRIERALRRQEAATRQESLRLSQFLAAIEASPNGVLMLDEGDHITWCNAVAAQHFGIDPVRDLSQRITNLVRLPAFVFFIQAGDFEQPLVFALPGAHPLGRTTLSVMLRAYGEGYKLVLSQDITERERNEAMRRDFVANVSHEIRTPLTVLAASVDGLDQPALKPAERDHVLTLLRQQVTRMHSLVEDLLTLAQLEGSPNPAANRWEPLRVLMQRVCADAQVLSAGRHTITMSDVPLLELAGSHSEFFSALANLMTNAVRYTPENGNISLTATQQADGRLAIVVSDTGIGVSAEHLPRLTERFYRVDGSRSRETGGTGLGLSIVKHVMQRHGGEVLVHSEPGRGSRFTLLLPAARVRAATSSSTATAVQATAS